MQDRLSCMGPFAIATFRMRTEIHLLGKRSCRPERSQGEEDGGCPDDGDDDDNTQMARDY